MITAPKYLLFRIFYEFFLGFLPISGFECYNHEQNVLSQKTLETSKIVVETYFDVSITYKIRYVN